MKPFINLSIKGEKTNIDLKKIALNEDGDIKYRFSQEAGDPIERISLNAVVYKDVLSSVSVHTWDADGHHLDIFAAENIPNGGVYEDEVEINKDGIILPLKIKLAFCLE